MGKVTVLIVDDAYFMRNLIKRTLKEADYDVVGEAKNGMEGVKMYFDLRPDIVCMDINMPDISGIEATKQIMSKDPQAKVIAITGNNDDEIKRQMIEAGAKEYLKKPFQPAFLWTKLDRMLSQKVEPEPLTPPKPSNIPNVLVIEEGVEDSFEEIEILSQPDASKMQTFEVENNEDSIRFPEEYSVSQDEYVLSKERIEEDSPIVEDPEPVVEQTIPLVPFVPTDETEPAPATETKPHSVPKESSIPTISIRPPRAKILRDDPLNTLDDEEMEEPVMNVSSTNYNDEDKPNWLSKVKKLFKK